MFDKILAADTKIYTTTAANPNQSSWATYCSPDDVIGGKHVGSCLGDEYSVNWLEDSDRSKDLSETLQTQFENIKKVTKGSEVHQYGDLSYVTNPIGNYQGNGGNKGYITKAKKIVKNIVRKIKSYFGKNKDKSAKKAYREYLTQAKLSKVNSREAKLRYLYEKAERMNDLESQNEYLAELAHVQKADSIFSTFNEVFNVDLTEVKNINFECLRAGVEAYKATCQWGEYDLQFVRNIAVACESNTSDVIVDTIEGICA